MSGERLTTTERSILQVVRAWQAFEAPTAGDISRVLGLDRRHIERRMATLEGAGKLRRDERGLRVV